MFAGFSSSDSDNLDLIASGRTGANSSTRLKEVIFFGPNPAIEYANTILRLARMRLLEARADLRELNQ